MKVAIYVRTSKVTQDYQRQITELRNYAEKHNYEVVKTICEKISGDTKNDDRSGIRDILELAEQGKIQKLLVHEISRIGRRTSQVLAVVERLTELKVSVFVLNYGLETLTSAGGKNPVAQIIFTILAEFARLERETLRERIISGLDQAKRRGKRLGRPIDSCKNRETMLRQYKVVVRSLKKGSSLREIAKLCDVSVNTVRKVKSILA